jgi:hypothetical protein
MSEKGIVRVLPKQVITVCSECGHPENSPTRPEPAPAVSRYSRWVGRIVIFELTTGLRVQGKILGGDDVWLDTDNGAVKVEHIVHAKWVSDEEARIIRGGPLARY